VSLIANRRTRTAAVEEKERERERERETAPERRTEIVLCSKVRAAFSGTVNQTAAIATIGRQPPETITISIVLVRRRYCIRVPLYLEDRSEF
jgi:hypothetical protein